MNRSRSTPQPETPLQTVKRAVSVVMDVPQKDVRPEHSFIDELGCDSLDCVEIVMAVEAQFELEISDETATRLNTVGKLANYAKENRRDK